MNLATLALSSILAFSDTSATTRNNIYIPSTRDTFITPQESKDSTTVKGPVLTNTFYRRPEEHHEYHLDHNALPHERHLPFSLHRNRLHGAEHNFPYEHLALGVHAGTKHLELELDLVIETEPHEHHNYATIRRVPGIGFAISYHR